MAKVFINFRNGDDPYAAALIFRALRQRFGADRLFRSSDSIPPGARWEQVIWENHRDSAVLIAVIGPRWLTVTDRRGDTKLHHEGDWVRAEIAAALARGTLVIPVLLDGASRFTRSDLPEDLAGLADLQTVSMNHRQIDVTIDALAAEVARVIGSAHPAPGRLDETPATGQWLGVWNIPRRPPVVIDREALIGAVRAEVGEARGMLPVVLHGDVGAGKTQIAIEYAHRYAGDYQCAWWVSGNRPELIAAELAGLARAAGFAPAEDIVAGLPALFGELRRQGRWLLVFDGVEDPHMLAPYLPAIDAGGDVLITTRDADWGLLAAPLRVGCFDRPHSVGLLSRVLDGAGEAELDRLAAALDDIPLAIAQAAVFLAGARIDVDDYVQLLRTRARELLSRGETYLGGRPLAVSWSVGLERLEGAAPDAAELFELVSVLAAAPVPLSVLASPVPAFTPALARSAGDPIGLADLVRTVARSGLMRVDRDSLYPHALFQAFIRQGLDAERQALLRASGRSAFAAMPRPDPRSPEAWAVYDRLLPHAFALDLVESDDAPCQRLLLDIVGHLVVRADHRTARDLATAATTRWRDRYGPDAEPAIAAAGRLAQALFRLGDYAGAETLDADVLARRHRLRGADDPKTLDATHNLAMDRWASGADVTGARALLDTAISGRRRTLGADHPDTLRSVHNLAVILRATGEVEAARDLDEDTHRRLRASLGADHPDTLRSGYALALDLRTLRCLPQARTLAWDTCERARRTLGADHPDTLRAAYGCAVDLRLAGELNAAHRMAGDTFERRRRVLGEDHADTHRSAYLLGVLMCETGDADGIALIKEAAAGLAGSVRSDVAVPR